MSEDAKYSSGTAQKPIEIVFQPDEMNLRSVNSEWSENELLQQTGIFYLKDVTNHLGLASSDLKKQAREFQTQDIDPWVRMGIRKTWTHWIVRMTIFSKFYQAEGPLRIQRVNPNWDANDLLSKTGIFYLTEVCTKLPFTPHQIRYQVKQSGDARTDFGVWKDPNHKSYLIEMQVFAKWIREVWLSN